MNPQIAEFKAAAEGHATKINGRFDDIEARLQNAEQLIVSQPSSAPSAGIGGINLFASAATVEIQNHADELDRHGRLRLTVQSAATDLITTETVGVTQNVGTGAPRVPKLGLQYALNNITDTTASTVQYSRFLGTQGDAAVQASEGALKAAVRGEWLLVDQPSITVAGHSRCSKQALRSNTQLQSALQNVMTGSLGRGIDDMLWNGEAGKFAGFAALAYAHTSAFEALPDAIIDAVAVVQSFGSSPTAVVMAPATWVAIVTTKAEGSGEYLSGDYLGSPTMSVHGLPVVLSLSVPAGKAVLIDSASAELIVTAPPTIEVGYVDQQFIKNESSLLVESSVAPVLKNAYACCLVTPTV